MSRDGRFAGWMRLLLPVALAVTLVALGCGGQTSSKLALSPCEIGAFRAECGQLRVAENPSEPDGKRIALNVAVVRALSTNPKHDPVFWFSGWGGAGVSDDASGVITAFSNVNVDRDIVFIDQR